MTSYSKLNLLFLTIFFSLIPTCVISFGTILKANESFTVYIIHRDSPKSPLFDNTTTNFLRFHNALLRSEQRLRYLFPNNTRIIHDDDDDDPRPRVLLQGLGEYMMQYSLGFPLLTTYGYIDTGSSWPWLQCKPASSSYNQGQLEFLDTRIFRALVPIDYNTPMCNDIVTPSIVGDVSQDPTNCQCMYEQNYYDGSGSRGHAFYTLLRLQTITGGYVGFPYFVFGCSRAYSGYFNPAASGIVGFGRGSASLVTQISTRIDGKFGYCLVPIGGPNDYSKMMFGQSAVVSGPDVVSTPLIAREESNYWVTLGGISVGNKLIPFTSDQPGNMLIDSATILTNLPQEFYLEVEAELRAQLDLLHVSTPDPIRIFSLCYLQNSIEEMGGPTITFHLHGGDLVLSAENIYVKRLDHIVCFNFKPIHETLSIFGTMTQANFMVSYDLQRRRVSFKKMNCAST